MGRACGTMGTDFGALRAAIHDCCSFSSQATLANPGESPGRFNRSGLGPEGRVDRHDLGPQADHELFARRLGVLARFPDDRFHQVVELLVGGFVDDVV